MQEVNFEYKIQIKKIGSNDIRILSYNSPYEDDSESVKDIKEAQNKTIFSIDDMDIGEEKDIKFMCKFIKNNGQQINKKEFVDKILHKSS